MKKGLILGFCTIAFAITITCLPDWLPREKYLETEEAESEDALFEARMQAERLNYEIDMLKDPKTGKIPEGAMEAAWREALNAPVKNASLWGMAQANSEVETNAGASNNWQVAGPTNVGGRTRAIAYDVRFNGTTNRVILAGSVSGGIMRSADGGSTWTRVSPDQQVHNLTCLAQDPRPGFQDTWYAGTGEALGNSASGTQAFFLGHGIFKSTDNGLTWAPLASTQGGSLTAFDNTFDIIHKIAINPFNGDVYAACQATIQRSQNGGTTWSIVRGTTISGTSTSTGNTDVVINSTGSRIYTAFHQRNATERGVWVSTTGDLNSWTLLGGNVTGTPNGWTCNESTSATWGRIVMCLAPSNQNLLYVAYENGKSQASPSFQSEIDIFKCNVANISNPIWTNLSSNGPNVGANSNLRNPISLQGGYNQVLAVKPNDSNFVLIGGTVLYRSTDGFSTLSNQSWIGGYGFGSIGATNNEFGFYPNSHPDIHAIAFDPTNPNRAICGNDGGIQVTNDITAPTVAWTNIMNYQTLQYYHVAIDPETGKNNFFGGAQDNGSLYRDASLNMGARTASRPTINDHEMVGGGDGVSVDIGRISAGKQPLYLGAQSGTMIRDDAINYFTTTQVSIRPPDAQLQSNGSSGFGEFVTVFKLSHANSEALFYVNYNRLFRTTQASTVTQTSATSWERMTGVENAVNAAGGSSISIRSMDFSYGQYLPSHVMYFGTTNGRLFRVNDYLNAATSTTPTEITPSGLTGNIQDIAVNPNNDNEIMVVVSNYNTISIWWTRNAKQAIPIWYNAEGNLTSPSIRSCAIVAKKVGTVTSSEYYVGTSVGLYSCEDMGYKLEANQAITWTREAPSLINFAVVTTMDYRPEDNVLLVGTHGNGMYFCELGGANFNPNNPTALNTIVNDKNFIRSIQPSASRGNFSYLVGNATGVRNMSVRVLNIAGQVVYQNNVSYADGTLPLQRFAAGTYVIEITSDNRKYRSLQKVIKN